MKSKIILLFLFLLFPSVRGFAQIHAEADRIEIMKLIERNRELTAEGKFFEAKKGYEKLLENNDLKKNQRRLIRKDYERLNMKIIFSPAATPDSIMHTVTEGDNLYKLSKKYNTTTGLIKKSNGLEDDVIYRGKELKIQKGVFSVVVDKSENILKLYSNDNLVKTYRVATGEKNSTPVGKFKVVTKVENPTWYHGGAVLPHDDPKNILGTRWLGFDVKGYGIHGTTLPKSIGRQLSSGCVRMFNREVEELYDILPLETEIKIQD